MNQVQTTIRATDIASQYSIGLSTVWYLVRQGKLKAYRPSPGTTLFKMDEVEEYFLGKI